MAGKRRGTDTAGITKTPDGYKVRVSYRDEMGKRRERQATCPTYAEAVRLRDELRAMPQDQARPPKAPTVTDYADIWLGRRKASGRYQPRTLAGYVDSLCRVCDFVGELRLDEIRRHHLQALSDHLAKTYAATTAQVTWGVARGCLKDGWADLGIPEPAGRVLAPMGPDKSAGRALSRAELEAILHAAKRKPEPVELLFLLLVTTGLRREEACQLRRDGVTLNGPTPYVMIGKAKTASGLRSVPIAPELANRIADYIARSPASVWVWPQQDASLPYSADMLYYHIRKTSEQLGLARVTPHDMRRTFLTELHRAHVDVVSRQVLAGHANAQEQARYIRADMETLAGAVSPVWAVIAGGKASAG